MQVVKKSILLLLTALIAFILFAPKRELYYLLQKKLQQEGIVLDQRKIIEKPLGLHLEEVTIYWQGIELGTFRTLDAETFLLYNRLDGYAFQISPAMQRFVRLAIDHLKIRYRLWNPRHLVLEAQGSFGRIHGFYDIKERMLRVRWTRIGEIENLRPYLKRDKEGWYYERQF